MLKLVKHHEGDFILSGELTRETVKDIDELKNIAGLTNNCIKFDLSAVTRVDTAGLAWLIHLLTNFKQQGLSLELQNIPEQLHKLMQLGQVNHLFE